MGENVRVVVRCRPMNRREHEIKCRNILEIEDCVVSVRNPTDLDAPAKCFTYDSVYNELSPTEAIYNDVCYSLVENVLEGYNGTIFAYGQTGCGKTHTMQGPDGGGGQMGIIPRCFEHIFEAISVSNGVRYLALVSYLEIYNENIRDLLSPSDATNVNHALKDIPGVGIAVPTLSSHTVINADECHRLLNMGNRNRMVGATLMNETSSRSHSIFTISLEQIQKDSADDSFETKKSFAGIRRGKLNLVDLAGSERQNKTGATGNRLKEATKINLSLSALGNVISALVDGKTKHVPYRDSKLTRLLQDSLGGNTKTLMISCISPADNNYDETLSTLRYASRAKNISNKPKINEDPKDAKLREYHQEILKLKQLLDESQQQQRKDGDAQMCKEIIQAATTSAAAEPNYEQQQPENNMRVAQIREESENDDEAMQLQTRTRIEMIKRALIGGERANDVQLRNVLKKRKIDAERRLSALAHVLSRVKQSDDRNLLQVHYTSIQQELNAKNDYLKACRQKIKALEREVSDLQSEFQLDRADYLESIRRLERNLKFYQLLMNKALPILRKDGKYWEPQEILEKSTWNDDLKTWRLPETTMYSFKLPPPEPLHASYMLGLKSLDQTTDMRREKESRNSTAEQVDAGRFNEAADEDNNKMGNIEEVNKNDILHNYFRSTRSKMPDYIKQTKGFQAWKDFTLRNKIINNNNNNNTDYMNARILSPVVTMPTEEDITTHEVLDDNYFNMNSTWAGGVGGGLLFGNTNKLHTTNEPLLRHSLNLEPRFKTGGNRKANDIFQIQRQQFLRGRHQLPKLERIS